MILRAFSALALAAALVVAPNGEAFAAPEGRPAAAATRAPAAAVPPLQFTRRVLANGLTVYALPDESTANVAVHVWYRVGAKDDPAGRSGFAHLFEHLMFKATRNMEAETYDRLTEDVGGYNNASTADDYTNYFAVVPANHLERILFAEADRMGSLVVDEAVFRSERDVVKEEFRQRILASPYGRLFYALPQASWRVHPYARPGIGSIEDLDAATLDDVRAFHATWYRPDNAVLVVSGRFDPAQLDRWVDRYFAPIRRPARPMPRLTVKEPPRTGPQTLTLYAPNAPLPAVALSWRTVAAGHADAPALAVLDAVLARGESSRLHQALVYESQLAASVFTWNNAAQDDGLLSAFAVLSGDTDPDAGLAALRAQIASLRDRGVSAAELEEAKNEIVAEALRSRETADGRAFAVAEAAIIHGDGRRADRFLEDVRKVTAADLRRVARTYLRDDRALTVRYLPEETKPEGATGDTVRVADTVVTRPLDIPAAEIPVHVLAAPAERVPLPAPGPAVAVSLPAPAERRLANGLRVIVASNPRLPLISASVRVMAGSAADPEGRSGVAALTGALVTQGAAGRSAADIAREIESLGAELGSGAGWDGSVVSLGTLTDRKDSAFAVFADVVKSPTLAAEELERQRRQTLDGLALSMRQPGPLANMAAGPVVFGEAPYGRAQTPAGVAEITREDVAAFHRAWWRPDNAVLVLTGDLTPEQGFALAERWFGDWAAPAEPLAAAPRVDAPARAPRAVVIDLPRSGQAAVLMAAPGLNRADPDYFAAAVADSLLGGGYSSRLNQEIRIKRGLSYGARSGLSARRGPGPVTASTQTKNESADEVVAVMIEELARMSAPVDPAELEPRKAVLIGGFGRTVETTSGLAGALSELALYDLPLERLGAFVQDVSAVGPDDVRRVAARLYDPARFSLVVVGDSALFVEALKRRLPTLEVIPVDRLDLSRPSLRAE